MGHFCHRDEFGSVWDLWEKVEKKRIYPCDKKYKLNFLEKNYTRKTFVVFCISLRATTVGVAPALIFFVSVRNIVIEQRQIKVE